MSEGAGHAAAIPYLYSPLPDELPPHVNKELLLLYAAYSGNIDRYIRLRDPKRMIDDEVECVVRGIYHDTMFARWWSMQPDMPSEPMALIRQAILARFIMNNDLSRITEETPENHLPYLIWYPHWADTETYLELARRKPSMTPQIARACIVTDRPDIWKAINPTPDWFLLNEAERANMNPFFREDIMRRTQEMGINLSKTPSDWDAWKDMCPWTLHGERGFIGTSPESVRWTLSDHQPETWFYNECGVNMGELELLVSLPEEWRGLKKDGISLGIADMFKMSRRPNATERTTISEADKQTSETG